MKRYITLARADGAEFMLADVGYISAFRDFY